MNIEDLTIGQARQLAALFGQPAQPTQPQHPYDIGANYFIRTATYHHTGKLVEVGDKELVLEQACWIAESGRFADALSSCNFSEVEPFPAGRVIIGRGAIIDAVKINTIPTSQK